jgi:hypothetical protein
MPCHMRPALRRRLLESMCSKSRPGRLADADPTLVFAFAFYAAAIAFGLVVF